MKNLINQTVHGYLIKDQYKEPKKSTKYLVDCRFCDNEFYISKCGMKINSPKSCGCNRKHINVKFKNTLAGKKQKYENTTIFSWKILEIIKVNSYFFARCEHTSLKFCRTISLSVLLSGNSKGENWILPQYQGLYVSYAGMKERCYNKNVRAYKWYGGKGVTVCDRWLENFYNFVEDMYPTYQDGLTIDRISCNGNYEPNNCRWLTPTEQNRNQTKTKMSMEKARELRALDRDSYTNKQIADMYGISESHAGKIYNNRYWKE